MIGRRKALASLGTVGLGSLLAACSGDGNGSGAATTRAEVPTTSATTATVQPRSDIREDRPGTLLRLALRIQTATICEPISNAVVDLWHCDAGGIYSGFESASQGQGGGGGRTDEETYLRGAQVTNTDGIVEFATIYPGWYRGRTTHIHLKVHLDKATLLTSQLFFDEAVNSAVYAKAPYSSHSGRETFNDDDDIFQIHG